MKEILINLFGEYVIPTYNYTVTITQENINPETLEVVRSTTTEIYKDVAVNGVAGVDWVYIGGVGIFCICLVGVFKIAGIFLSRLMARR